jgi:Tol biopolymer transport system component/DNA-binding winged helix-turn-helix (wHTH) protein
MLYFSRAAVNSQSKESRTFRFGNYTADLATGELWKNGVRVRLEAQPFRLLAMLLQRPGEIVTREEIRQSLWPNTPFVDFDNGLNIAILKIRKILNDSAAQPRFIETLPKRGYRFIAPILPENTSNVTSTIPAGADESRSAIAPRRPLPAIALAAVVVACGILGLMWLRWPEPQQPGSVVKFAYNPGNDFREPVISPDSRRIAYVAGGDESTLWIQELSKTAPRKLPGTEGARGPFWSPDGKFLGFAAGAQLKKISVDDGVLTTICELPYRDFYGGAWSPEGEVIVFSTFAFVGEVPAQGGSPKSFGRENSPEGHFRAHPHFLPLRGRGALLSTVGAHVRNVVREGQVTVLDVGTGESKVLVDGRFPVFAASGHLIYQRVENASTLWALPFSLKMLRPIGDAFPIAQNASHPSVSRNGTLVYREGSGSGRVQLFWHDRRGRKLGAIGQPQDNIRYPDLSPDGRSMAVRGLEDGNYDIWLHDTRGPRKERFTFEPTNDNLPVWSPTGKHLLFMPRHESETGPTEIKLQPRDRSLPARMLVRGPYIVGATDWSPDGQFVLIYRVPESRDENASISYLKRTGNDEVFEERSFLRGPKSQFSARFSPDGRFVVYSSNETGRAEIWVRPFGRGEQKWLVSDGGGLQPRWSKDGTEIFYVEDDRLVAVKVSVTPEFSRGPKEILFRSDSLLGSIIPQYDVSDDGERIAVARPLHEDVPAVIRVVQNWYEEFRKDR